MASSERMPSAYWYNIPAEQGEQELRELDVAYVSPKERQLYDIAVAFQTTMQEAWTAQFEGMYTSEEISLTVNGHNSELIAAQMSRLKSGNFSEPPTYTIARLAVPVASNNEPNWCVAGIGKGDRADNRSRARRLLGGTPSEKDQLADVSNIFVKPTSVELGVSLQGRGIGSAVLRTLLDVYPEDMSTVVYDYPANPRVVETLGRLGFQAGKTWEVDLFGHKVAQTCFDGPSVGELIETIEQRRPWLKERQPVD
jgi:hypothetical protein